MQSSKEAGVELVGGKRTNQATVWDVFQESQWGATSLRVSEGIADGLCSEQSFV